MIYSLSSQMPKFEHRLSAAERRAAEYALARSPPR